VNAPQGYLHRAYAESFAEFGRARELPAAGGWILERVIPHTDLTDAMGCYPVFACQDWRGLETDLPRLADDLVSLTIVTDPFGGVTEDGLRRAFDVVTPYKCHFVTELRKLERHDVPRAHRRNIAKALGRVRLATTPDPLQRLNKWVGLYEDLVERHRIGDLRKFSRVSFAQQFRVPGLVMFEASVDDEIVGLHTWCVHGNAAYGHLGVSSAKGYEVEAAYALYDYAIRQLSGQVHWLDLGSAPGPRESDTSAGLKRFKEGWSTGTQPTYLCGRIFQPETYARLVRERAAEGAAYFPAYRVGEFT